MQMADKTTSILPILDTMKKLFYLITLIVLIAQPVEARFHFQTDFTAADFQARRNTIYEAIGDNIAIIQGAQETTAMFRQSNSFYYLSGLESPTSYMLLNGKSRETVIFLPHRDAGRERVEGQVLSYEDAELVKKLTGVNYVMPIEKIGDELNYYLWDAPHPALFTPHSPDEKSGQSRDEMLSAHGRRMADPWDGRPSKAGHFINLLNQRYPQLEIRDLSATLDLMRSIKDEKEIALIRKASQLAGLGIMEAMRSTKPEVMEYQLEAVARFVFQNNGARDISYKAIVGGGKNAWMGHYSANADPVKDGDLILMDMAPDYHYYTSDVARMWPANGKYSKDQRDLYGFVIAYHKAFMRYLRPGVTPTQILEEANKDMRVVLDGISFSKEIYRKACEKALTFSGHVQHAVGMTVHDFGGHWGNPLEPGMVFSIDPMIWIPEEKLYIRMEDVIVITKDGVENLSSNIPFEMDEIEALMREQGIVQTRPAALN